MQKRKPPYLYKYRPIREDDRDKDLQNPKAFTRRILTHNELYFAPFKSLNDPFDCRAYYFLNTNSNDPRIENYIQSFFTDVKRYLIENDPNVKQILGCINDKNRAYIIDKFMESKVDKKILEDFLKSDEIRYHRYIFDEHNKNHGILSLTSENDNILMFSHYADCHKGLCLQFNIDDNFFKNVIPVEYSSQYPEIDLSSPDALKIFFRKAEDWSYEKEYRLVKHEEPGVYTYPPQLLTGVIFGCEISS